MRSNVRDLRDTIVEVARASCRGVGCAVEASPS
jgi:hypothetical protein